MGLIVRLVVAGVLVVGAVGAVLVAVPTPAACSPDIAIPEVTDAQAKWEMFTRAPAPASVSFDEGEATAELLNALGTEKPPVDVRQVHFCADGRTQVAFDYPFGPLRIHGLAIGTIPATSPLRFNLESIALGWIPEGALSPLVGAVRDLVDRVSSFGLTGPVTRIDVQQGSATVHNE